MESWEGKNFLFPSLPARSHHPPPAFLACLQLSRVVSRCSPLSLGKACGGGSHWRVLFIGCHLILVPPQDFIHRHTSQNHLIQHNTQYHRKVLLSSFHLNGHTSAFHPQTHKLESPYTASYTDHKKVLLSSFHLNGHTYKDLIYRHTCQNQLKQHNTRYHRKVLFSLLSSFHKNGVTYKDLIYSHTSQNHLKQHNTQYHRKVLLSSFHLNGHTKDLIYRNTSQNHLTKHNIHCKVPQEFQQLSYDWPHSLDRNLCNFWIRTCFFKL